MKRFILLTTAAVLAACGIAREAGSAGKPAGEIIAGGDSAEDAYTLGNLDFRAVESRYPAPFKKGVNLTEWFQSSSPQTIPFTKYTEETFKQVKSLGADVIRLPLNLHSFTTGAPAYTLDPLFLSLLDQAVDWAEKHQLYLILDNHSFDPVADTPEDIGDILIPVWTQMAERYKDRSRSIMYEVLNEPHGINDSVWGEIQGGVIAAIRSKDPVHTIIVGGTGYNSIHALTAIPRYADENLIYTFHFYDPYLFTHQGETWGSPPNLRNLKGVPFPSDAHAMPETPADLKGTWVEQNLKSQYPRDGQPETLAETLNKASAFSNDRQAPVFCGEFGVYMINSLHKDRLRWYTVTARFLDERGIARTNWDYFGGFGLFKTQSGGSFYSDLDADIVRALGWTPPEQRAPEKIRSGFVLYDDYPRNGTSITYWGTGGASFSMYGDDAADGAYCLVWKNPRQYHSFRFNLTKDVDWAYLKDNGYALRFKVKTDSAGVSFDVRFINPENAESIPWRMRFTVESDAAADDAWRAVTIPFSDMEEHGAWINATQEWRNPQGQFSWEDIETLEFDAEAGDITGSLRFDSIEVVQPQP